jgi:hypothetical protein
VTDVITRPSAAEQAGLNSSQLASRHQGQAYNQLLLKAMNSARRTQLIKQRAVAREMLSRIQNFIEVGDQKLNDIQVRFNKLPNIFNRYDIAQSELDYRMTQIILVIENYLKISTTK